MTLKKFAESLALPAETATTDAAVCMKMGAVLRFLQRYAIPDRPVTPYDLMGADVPAVTALLDAMGITGDLRTEVRSVLDPGSVQLRWDPQAGAALERLGALAAPVWLADAWCALHRKDAKAAAGALPDTELPSVAQEGGETEGATPRSTALRDATFAMTDWAIQKVLSDRAGMPHDAVGEWASIHLNRQPAAKAAFPPLAVIEEALRGYGRAGTLPVTTPSRICYEWAIPIVRPLKPGESVPAMSSASMPLENIGWFPFEGYALKARNDWLSSRTDATAAWLRADIDILHHPDSLAVAADQRRMADWIADTIDAAFEASGNPEVKAAVMPHSSRLAVHNVEAGVPEDDDDTGDDARWTYMGANSSMDTSDVRYLANIVISTDRDLIARLRAEWDTVPALTAPPKVVAKAEDAKAAASALDRIGLAAEELSTEWFAMVHGLPETSEIGDVDLRCPPVAAFEARLANLEGMRKFFNLPGTAHTVAEMSRPTSPTLMVRSRGPHPPFPLFLYSAPKLFVDKVATLLRKATEPAPLLPIVAMADRHAGFENFLITGLWSGLVTDRSGTERNAECFPKILPGAGMTPVQLTEALGMLHADPTRQLRCASRTGSSHRRHVVAVETNIDYAKLMERLRASQKEASFIDAMRLAWATTFHFWDMDVQAPRRHFSTGVLPEADGLDLDAFRRYVIGVHADAGDFGTVNFTTMEAFTTHARTAILDMEAAPDARGRLVLLFATRSFTAIDAGKTMWRWLSGFPVLTASSRGGLDPLQFAVDGVSSVVVADPSEPRRTYLAMLRAITRQAKFARDLSGALGSVESFCGCAGVAWPETALYDMDLNEGDQPTREDLADVFGQTRVVPAGPAC